MSAIKRLIQQYCDEMQSYQDIYGATDMATVEHFASEALAELETLETMKQRILDRVAYIQGNRGNPANRGLEASYAGEMTMAIMALGYDPTREKGETDD